MLKMIFQDLRISPGRSFLTGFSMLVGILAVIASVLAGTIGKAYLVATNEQLYGRAATYSTSFQSQELSNPAKVDLLLKNARDRHQDIAFTFNLSQSFSFLTETSHDNPQNPPSVKDLENALSVDTVVTSADYARVFNLPISAGRWLNPSSAPARLEVVANKAAENRFRPHTYTWACVSNSLTFTPMEIVGVVNDGLDYPRLYVNVEGITNLAPTLWQSQNATVYWHDANLSHALNQRQGLLQDLLHDSLKAQVGNLQRSDSTAYEGVVSGISLSFLVVSVLLLFVSALGLVNIGLASIQQRSHELLIRRALGATRSSIALLVLGSSTLLAVLVALTAIVLSVIGLFTIPLLLPADSPVTAPSYPYGAAAAAVTAAIVTALIGGIVPAIKATRLEPALALR